MGQLKASNSLKRMLNEKAESILRGHLCVLRNSVSVWVEGIILILIMTPLIQFRENHPQKLLHEYF